MPETYTNPIIFADYSDPDVCRVGNDYYMTSSSFNCFPGLQILHSTDLVHWEIIGAALEDYPVEGWGDRVQHGMGVWAPAIRYHNGEFYIFCGDPDRGVFMVKAKDPRGRWSAPVWVVKAKGYIDPSPLWDDDGQAYLAHGCAGTRAGIKSVLYLAPMAPDGTKVLGPSRIVYDGHKTQPTIEGTKIYKRGGYYYIFSPAGGVPTGWQVVLRSMDPYGTYEERVVMAQGESPINGPHQGAWVETQNGENWFIHFQDRGVYGRVLLLEPMAWVDDWPVIGEDSDGDGVGEPVTEYRLPRLPRTIVGDQGRTVGLAGESFDGSGSVGESPDSSGLAGGASVGSHDPVHAEGYANSYGHYPADSDEFNDNKLGLQWQWQAPPSPYWSFADANAGVLRLYSVQQREDYRNLSDAPNLLLQKLPAADFMVTAKLGFVPNPQLEERGEVCGLVFFGDNYSALKLVDTEDGIVLQKVVCMGAADGGEEVVEASVPLESRALPEPYSAQYMSTTVPPVPPVPYVEADVYLRIRVQPVPHEGNVDDALCVFSYSVDGEEFTEIGNWFVGVAGNWIGAKIGLFCVRTAPKNDSGWVDIDWFRVEY
ncbi:MAG: family 43 glycosylhydrolase [Bacteroidales bacterium]|nr:family 43 glycosylhydrolase [Bacteroidales bacterium]